MLDDISAVEDVVKRVVIIGGGTAGWMTAAGLATMLGKAGISITLVESETIGVVGVGEATLPHIKAFNDSLGIDEAEFMSATSATFKLGIEFVDWGKIGDSYIHPFGEFGLPNNGVAFHQYWARVRKHESIGALDSYSLPVLACRAAKFEPPSTDPRSVMSTYRYAYQFDSLKYAPFLRALAEGRGVTRCEGKVIDVDLNSENGQINAVRLEAGHTIEGDFFIDCTGFIGLLIEKTLQTGYEPWTHWLPCDRAIAAPCKSAGPLVPYTRATAGEAGWRWRIPLHNRTGNGHVYASDFISDSAAERELCRNLEGELLSEPRLLRFVTGKRRKLWNRNCVAIGLSGGFLEPLESTSIYLIQEGITKLLEFFPHSKNSPVDEMAYNRAMDLEFERVRDFLVLHYRASQRDDSEFWRHMRAMQIPDSLQEKIDLFRARGRVPTYDIGLFLKPSWVAVMIGQGLIPEAYDDRVDDLPEAQILQHLNGLQGHMQAAVSRMADHQAYIQSGMSSTVSA